MRKLTPMRAIRLKCLDCCCGQTAEVRLCTATGCVLWPFRMGHRPKDEEVEESAGDEKTETFSVEKNEGGQE